MRSTRLVHKTCLASSTRLCTLVSPSLSCAVLSACWSALRLPNSCQPLEADICSRSRAARSSTARCLTSCLLYSFNDVTMQWNITESCEESAPGYSANHGSTDCALSSSGSVVRLGTPLNTHGLPFSCTCLVHRIGEPCGGQKWNVWNLKLDLRHVLVTGVLDRVVG